MVHSTEQGRDKAGQGCVLAVALVVTTSETERRPLYSGVATQSWSESGRCSIAGTRVTPWLPLSWAIFYSESGTESGEDYLVSTSDWLTTTSQSWSE